MYIGTKEDIAGAYPELLSSSKFCLVVPGNQGSSFRMLMHITVLRDLVELRHSRLETNLHGAEAFFVVDDEQLTMSR